MSEQLKKFTYKWDGNDWGWVDGGPFRSLSFEVKMVRAEDADALAERLREAEAALEFYADRRNWTEVYEYDNEGNELIYSALRVGRVEDFGGERAREYFEKWANKRSYNATK